MILRWCRSFSRPSRISHDVNTLTMIVTRGMAKISAAAIHMRAIISEEPEEGVWHGRLARVARYSTRLDPYSDRNTQERGVILVNRQKIRCAAVVSAGYD
jgi:hypothetical protein